MTRNADSRTTIRGSCKTIAAKIFFIKKKYSVGEKFV